MHHHRSAIRFPGRRGVVGAILASALLVGATGCADEGAPEAEANDRPLVLTTFTVTADMARSVTGDLVDVESITKPGAEIHDYEPTASDIAKASEADLILSNGFGLERWLDRFVADSDATRVTLSDGVEPIDISDGEYSGNPNPHAWMSPTDGQIYVDNIVKALSTLDPDHAADYERNGADYKAKIQDVSDGLKAELETVPANARTLVTCEGAFSYLARDTGLDEVYLWPVNSASEGTPQQIARVVDHVRERQVPTVFCESTVNGKAMEQVASETGATFNQDEEHLLYVDSLSAEDGPVPTYLALLQHDADAIASGLAGESASK